MLPRFVSYISNGTYDIGCTGQTVYVYDKYGAELAKFKDLIYAYYSAITPRGDMFVVKSADGRIAVYSLTTLSLIKKFRYSKVNYAQHDGFCFSADGKYFINIERQGGELHSAISVYDIADFSRVSQFLLGDIGMLRNIEQVDGELYVIGFWRNSDLIVTKYFVAKYAEGKISEPVNITENEYEYYNELLLNKKRGENVKNHTLATIWGFYST